MVSLTITSLLALAATLVSATPIATQPNRQRDRNLHRCCERGIFSLHPRERRLGRHSQPLVHLTHSNLRQQRRLHVLWRRRCGDHVACRWWVRGCWAAADDRGRSLWSVPRRAVRDVVGCFLAEALNG